MTRTRTSSHPMTGLGTLVLLLAILSGGAWVFGVDRGAPFGVTLAVIGLALIIVGAVSRPGTAR